MCVLDTKNPKKFPSSHSFHSSSQKRTEELPPSLIIIIIRCLKQNGKKDDKKALSSFATKMVAIDEKTLASRCSSGWWCI